MCACAHVRVYTPCMHAEARAPRLLHATYSAWRDLSTDAAKALWRTLARDGAVRLRFWNDTQAEHLVRSRCGAHAHAAYRRLVPPVARADLFRYCVLLVEGGAYMDADAELLRPLRTVVRPDDAVVLAADRLDPDEPRGTGRGAQDD